MILQNAAHSVTQPSLRVWRGMGHQDQTITGLGSMAFSTTSLGLPLRRGDLEALGLRGLHCGSGRTLHRGFLNSDVMQLRDGQGHETVPGRVCCFQQQLFYLQHDQTTPLPIEDACFDWVFSEHFIEHISLEQAVSWLREVRRVLKPGGVARISTPDLALYANGYGDPQQTFYRRHHAQLESMGMRGCPSRPAWMLNQIFRNYGHQWIYDLEEIILVARAAGFDPRLVQRCVYRQGSVPELAGLDQESRSDESLYVEIRKPADATMAAAGLPAVSDLPWPVDPPKTIAVPWAAHVKASSRSDDDLAPPRYAGALHRGSC